MVQTRLLWGACLLAAMGALLGGCRIIPPIDDRGQFHDYGSLREIMRHVDHYHARLQDQRGGFRTSIASFDDLMLYCDYVQALCRQARYRYGTNRPELTARAVNVVKTVREIMIRARGLETDKDLVGDLMDELARRIDLMKKAA